MGGGGKFRKYIKPSENRERFGRENFLNLNIENTSGNQSEVYDRMPSFKTGTGSTIIIGFETPNSNVTFVKR